MVAVREITWEEASAPDFENPARKAWREAVAEIATKAKQIWPECNGRVDSAVKIVLNGDVELLPDGKAQVASQSNGTTAYFVVNGACECKDFAMAPSQWCTQHCGRYPQAGLSVGQGQAGRAERLPGCFSWPMNAAWSA